MCEVYDGAYDFVESRCGKWDKATSSSEKSFSLGKETSSGTILLHRDLGVDLVRAMGLASVNNCVRFCRRDL